MSALVQGSAAVSAEVEADLALAAHRRRVDERLQQASDGRGLAWSDALAACEGADPRLVAQRVRALGLGAPASTARGPADPSLIDPGLAVSGSADRWTPELHARDFEWYFTPSCAAELAARVATPEGSVLCLGTPTVAFALLEHPGPRRVTLVDHNPLAPQRHGGAGLLHAMCEDLAAARLEAGRYDAAVFDAPWYPPALHRWLAVAAAAVRPGGRVSFALMQPLHRPRAAVDRASILARARRLGPVTVEPSRLRYESPRFEREALAAAGLTVPEAWRRADLVELVVQRPADHPPPPPALSPEPAWMRFVVGSQVIHLDPHATATAAEDDVLSPIGHRSDYRYASISTRDPRRAEIGLWTSRSRVARVGRPELVAAGLERLAQTGEHRGLETVPALRALPARARARLLHALRVIVGPFPS